MKIVLLPAICFAVFALLVAGACAGAAIAKRFGKPGDVAVLAASLAGALFCSCVGMYMFLG